MTVCMCSYSKSHALCPVSEWLHVHKLASHLALDGVTTSHVWLGPCAIKGPLAPLVQGLEGDGRDRLGLGVEEQEGDVAGRRVAHDNACQYSDPLPGLNPLIWVNVGMCQLSKEMWQDDASLPGARK